MTTRSLIPHDYEVRAALAGTLGLVVRPVQPQPTMIQDMAEPDGYDMIPTWDGKTELHMSKCPLGVPGDRLRCRETWGYVCKVGILGNGEIVEDDHVVYRATGSLSRVDHPGWRSPATMPVWASRITLEVVEVRCVRAKDITEDDARVCGLPPNWCGDLSGWSADDHGFLPANWTRKMEDDYGFWTAQESLESHWTAKYAPRYPWDTSWAWAAAVRVIK